MGMLNWERIYGADIGEIGKDEDIAEQYFTYLINGDLHDDDENIANPKAVVQLFNVTKAVLNIKGLQYEAAVDEMEKILEEKDRGGGKETLLLGEIEDLKAEITQYQKYSGTGDKYLRAELQQLEERNKLLQKELEELDKRLLKEQTSYDRVNTEMQSLETRHLETKKELDRALNDIKEYQRQFQSQRENLIMKRSNVDDVREQMSKKNKELSEYLDEIKELQDANDKLHIEINKARKEMEDATRDMNEMADDYSKLKTVLEETDSVVEDMRKERQVLRSQIQDMEVQLLQKTEGDDDIMLALNKKVAEWKDILATKDAEIQAKGEQILSLQKQLHSAKMDSDRNTVIELKETINKKDDQIKELKDKVDLASKEYDDVTHHIKTLKVQTKDGTPSLQQQRKIQTLNQTVQQEQLNTVKERERVIEVEQDIAEKDGQIAELVNRLIQYEQGQYGLTEAVQEIKDCRAQIRLRDKNIEDLTREINQMYLDTDDINLENEEMRERLGIGSREELDVNNIRKKRAVKEEQATALNRVLQKEVERLEEERVVLKRALRKQALERGERAVQLGLSSVDLEPLDDDVLPTSQQKIIRVEHKETAVKKAVRRTSKVDFSADENVVLQNKQFEEENQDLKEENRQLELGLREIHSVMKTGSGAIQVPSLDKLMAIIEERHATGQYDTTVQLKSQVQNLIGRNEELRAELRNVQQEITKTVSELDNRARTIDELEKENDALRELSQAVIKLNPLPLPDGINPTSKDIIACLNEYLIQILQEISNKETMCSDMEMALEELRRKYSVAMHQQSILYKDHLSVKEEKEKVEKKYSEEKEEFLLNKSQDDVKIQEFEKLMQNLETHPDRQKKLLTELTRKITVLRVNEKSLTRRYTILQDIEKHLRKQIDKMHKDFLKMEESVTSKLGNLERHKEASMYKITALQKALEDTVPLSELEITNRQLNELTAKYRDLLQRENSLVARSSMVETLQAELKAFQHSDKTLKEKLQLEKERAYALENTLSELVHKLGQDVSGHKSTTSEISSVSRKLATLEMKELNERERANHATIKYDQLRSLVAELENRNAELEQKFAETSKINLECQRVERDLRDQISNSVSAEVHRENRTRIIHLEEIEGKLRTECHKLKEITDIAQHQTDAITMRHQSLSKELESLRKQLYELQMETDEKTIIAKLHQHIVALQVSEATAVRRYEVANGKVKKFEMQICRLNQTVDDKNEEIQHIRNETRSKMRFLKVIIQDLRRQFSGALPLGQQERFSETLRTLQEKRISMEKELNEAKMKHLSAEDTAMELRVRYDGLQELIKTLKDGQGAKKVVEWHNRMGQIKLEDMKLKREVDRLKEQNICLDRLNQKNDVAISNMEGDIIKQAKEYEDRQLLWEQHEVELERKIAKLERQQKDFYHAAKKFEEATGALPDESLPIANQLEIAIVKIKEHIKTIVYARSETDRMQQNHDKMEGRLRAAEASLLHKDKIINELRLRLPLSDRFLVSKSNEMNVQSSPNDDPPQAKQALRVAQTTVDSLKLMLQKKDENIIKYQELLNRSREDLKSQADTHRQEIKVLQDRLQLEIEEHVKKIKKVHSQYVNTIQRPVPSNRQLKRLSELEEMIDEQDTALGTASTKHHDLLTDMKNLKMEAEENIKHLKVEIKRKSEEYTKERNTLHHQIKDWKSTVNEKDLEIEVLNQELQSAKEANEKAPSKTMKNLVERLRNQLAKKEKEQKALSQALLQIRSDMVTAAEDNVKAYSKKLEGESNIQRLLDKETGSLNEQLEILQEKVDKLKKEVKQKHENENILTAEIRSLKKDVHRKEIALRELGNDLKEREDFQEKFEKLKEENKKLEKQVKYNTRKPVTEDVIEVVEESGVQVENVLFSDLDERPVKETKNREEFIKWEENKKWQKKVDNLKTKLKEKTDECVNLEKMNTSLRDSLSRQEKEKISLQNRLKSLSKHDVDKKPSNRIAKDDIIAGLKQRIFQLEDENNEITRQLNIDRDRELQELRIQVSQQNETIHAIESQLMRKQADEDPEGFDWTLQREQKLQKEMLEIRKENMELRFENEQANKDVPRLKARVADLTEYVEILKGELEGEKRKEKSKKVAMGTGTGGQSVQDMERVIGAMRRVVERLQSENDSLKKKADKTRPSSDLVKENKTLKQEVQRLKQMKLPDNQRESSSKPSGRVLHENEKLRKEIEKEKNRSEKLRIAIQNLEAKNTDVQARLEERENALEELNNKVGTLTTSDGFNRSVIVNKMYEEKVRVLNQEISKKNDILKDIKAHIRGSAEREADLLRNIEELTNKVEFLQNFPPGVRTENEAVTALQQCRLHVKRVESEKAELYNELNRLRELTNDGEHVVDVAQDEILKKLQNYDKMLAMEVDLRTRIKSMEIERQKLTSENKKLKQELSSFDPAFFEELEDLKYNYQKSLDKNALIEEQLLQLSKQFGVSINIPSNDDFT